MNLYPEANGSNAKSDYSLLSTPGYSLFSTCPDQPHRGSLEINGRVFCVSGSTLFEISALGVATARGTVGNDGNQASLAASSIQVMIASEGQAFCLTLATNTLTGPVAGLTGVTQVGYDDGFFTATIGNSAQIFVSNLLDGTTWNLSNSAIVSVFPGNIVSTILDHRELCLLGNKQSVCYYDSGNVFPFDVVPGGFMEQGSAATFGAIKADNTYFWLGQDDRGGRIIWRAQGYTPSRISTHAIENQLRTYSTVSDCVAWSYQSNGHTFVVFQFPTADKTWVYDVATQLWHQRSFFQNGNHHAFLGISHVYAFSKHLIGDRQSGNLYQMDDSINDYAGNPKVWVRRAPYIASEGVWISFKELEIEMDTGVGLASGQGSDPQIMLRWSNTYANTWVTADNRSIGKQGNYQTRVRWSGRLGRCWGTKGRVFEISGSDPVPVKITDGYIQASPDMGPTPRLSAKLRSQA